MKSPNSSFTVVRIRQIGFALSISILITLSFISFLIAEPIHTRLNPNPAQGGSVKSYQVSPDGNHVGYLADQEIQGTDELYINSIYGGNVTKLNGTLVMGGNVSSFIFSPAGERVVYQADQEIDNHFAIYSVPLTGGAPINLTGDLPEGTRPLLYFLRQPVSSDGHWLIYPLEKRENGGTPHEFALISTALDQRTTMTLTPPMVANGGVWAFKTTPDSKKVIYLADQEVDEVSELYSVPIEGGSVTKLSGAMQDGDWVIDFYISPDGTQVIYHAQVNGKNRLSRVSLVDGSSTVIEETSTQLGFHGYFSPDGSKLLYYTQDGDGSLQEFTYKLYIAPVQKGDSLLLSSSADTEGSNTQITDLEFTPDGNTVLFGYNAAFGGTQPYAYSVPSVGGAKSKVADFPNYQFLQSKNYYFQISQDGKYLIHSLFNYSGQTGNLYSTDLATMTTITLTEVSVYNGPPFYLSPNNNLVIYRGRANQNSPLQLFHVPMTTTTTAAISIASNLDADSLWLASRQFGREVCVIYRLGGFIATSFRELYASCNGANWTHKSYLPAISR